MKLIVTWCISFQKQSNAGYASNNDAGESGTTTRDMVQPPLKKRQAQMDQQEATKKKVIIQQGKKAEAEDCKR